MLIEIFLELKKGLSEEFSKTGNQVVFEIKALSQEFSNQLLQDYYKEAFLKVRVPAKDLNLFIRIWCSCGGNQLLLKVHGASKTNQDSLCLVVTVDDDLLTPN